MSNHCCCKITPPVLSVGKLFAEGYSFVWRAGKTPYLKTPDGERIELEVRDHVPYLPDGPGDLDRRELAAARSKEESEGNLQALPSGVHPDEEIDDDFSEDMF